MNLGPSTLGTLLNNRHDIEQSGLVGGSKRQKVKHGKSKTKYFNRLNFLILIPHRMLSCFRRFGKLVP